MRKILLMSFLILFLSQLFSTTLKEVYDESFPQNEYDKYLELETGITYTGGLLIGKILSPFTFDLQGDEGLDVRIQGNGAILDLQGEEICISYCDNILDIEDCVIINGNVRFKGIDTSTLQGIPTGSVRYVTFYHPHDYGIRMTGCGDGITIERNIVVNAIDTGNDYIFMTGISSDWLPTGSNIAATGQSGFYGFPLMIDNWSYFSNEETNDIPLKHFVLLCEYG